jgi:hypothetical protein
MGKARTSRRDDLVMTRADSAPFGTPDTGRIPPPREGTDPLLGDVWRQAAVALAGWLILLGLTLLALSAVAQQASPGSAVGPSRLVTPDFRGSFPQQPSPEQRATR